MVACDGEQPNSWHQPFTAIECLEGGARVAAGELGRHQPLVTRIPKRVEPGPHRPSDLLDPLASEPMRNGRRRILDATVASGSASAAVPPSHGSAGPVESPASHLEVHPRPRRQNDGA